MKCIQLFVFCISVIWSNALISRDALMIEQTDTLRFLRIDGPYGKQFLFVSKFHIKKEKHIRYGFQYYGGNSIKYGEFYLKNDSFFYKDNCKTDTSYKFIGQLSSRQKSTHLPIFLCSPPTIGNIINKVDLLYDTISNKQVYKFYFDLSISISHIQFITYLIFDKSANIIEYGFYDGEYNSSYRVSLKRNRKNSRLSRHS